MSSLAVTAITDFVLAGEALFLAGMVAKWPKSRFSAAWFWGGVMLLLGFGALVAGIDHGFVEPANLPRYWIQRSNWIVLAGMTFCLLMTTSMQFFQPRFHRLVLVLALVQFAADTVVVLSIDSFLDVVFNYVPVMLLLLAMNVFGLRKGTGSPAMIGGIVILVAGSIVEAMRVDVFSPLDHNGLFHAVSMIGVVLLYLGGKQLRTERTPSADLAPEKRCLRSGTERLVRTQEISAPLWLLAGVAVVFLWSSIGCADRFTWFLEVLPAVIGISALVWFYPRFRFTTMVYSLVAVHAAILMIGGHYTYAHVPAFEWIKQWLHLDRNYYDRLGHFAQGFVPAFIIREALLRTTRLERGKILSSLVFGVCMGISALYELFEFAAAKITGTAADAFLGSQGDVWDTQWDMTWCLIGVTCALLFFTRRHDRSLARLDVLAKRAAE